MGLLKVVVLSGASALGFLSYRACNRVNQVVQSIKVPNYTLLGKHQSQEGVKEYKDAYSIELPKRFKLVKGTGSSKEISATDVARAFFTSKVFERFEKPLLTRLLKDKQFRTGLQDARLLNYKAFKFKEGDQILVWTVVARDLNEILFQWECGGIKGTTWFCVPVRDNTIYFGSSFPRPQPGSQTPSVEDFITSKPKELFIDAATNMKQNDNITLSVKIKNFFAKLLFRLSVPPHQVYSKFLLESTLERLIETKAYEEQQDAPRTPSL